jgi:uncharacterized repeat protein (TIGR03803 family)
MVASPAQTLTTVYSFCSQQGCSDGNGPQAGLAQGLDGNFYGTTASGGTDNKGTVYKITANGTLSSLYNFTGAPDGATPTGSLVQGADGNLFGTTSTGGAHNYGSIFKISPAGTLNILYSFCSQRSCPDGESPNAQLTRGVDGNFYGSTPWGGNSQMCEQGCGTIFKITPSGLFTMLYSFCSQPNCADGTYPTGGLTLGSDGNFYGTTPEGGGSANCYPGCGTVFKITPAGTFTTLHIFTSGDGFYSQAAMVQGADGNFYGTTAMGGSQAAGTIFRISTTGSFSTLHSFCLQHGCPDGATPRSGLVQGIDGNFYGTATQGGLTENCYSGCGILFKVTPAGAFSTLYEFCSQPNCTDGATPAGVLIQALDGNFYGTTQVGGNSNNGTVFSLSGPSLSPVQFVPVTPCRLVDTRQTHNPITGGTWQDFDLPQLGNCNIQPNAAVYSLNVTVVPHQTLAYLTLWPAGRNLPTVSTMNSLDGRTKANAAIVPAGAAGAVSVFATDTTDVILDIDGYFTAASQSTLKFYPLTPCRVADTRSSDYPQGLGLPHLNGGTARDFPVLNNTTCIPQGLNAAAYSFNLTAIPYPSFGNRLGYLEVWPTGSEPQNPVSTLNNPTGTDVANAAIVPAGTNGEITVYPSDNTDLAIDINGYFAASGSDGLSLYPTVPCRVFDSRQVGSGQPFNGLLSPPVTTAGGPCGVPSTAQAYVFNATVVPSGRLGYLTLWPDSEGQPGVSTLNAADGLVTSNMAIVPNVNGKIDAYAAGLTQLILDISSFFAP